jgi:transketolase
MSTTRVGRLHPHRMVTLSAHDMNISLVHSTRHHVAKNRDGGFSDPNAVRKTILSMLYRANASHLGSNMSAVEILIAMYLSVDREKILAAAPSRSRILISKGHCAAATYAVMAYAGLITFKMLESYHLDGSFLTGHVNHFVPHVEHSTGALGHGINVAVGCALGLRSKGYLDSKVLTMVGDGELQEGSVWEAVMFISHYKLTNLTLLVDNNRISSITSTSDVLDMQPLAARFAAFGLDCFEVDGHNIGAIAEAISNAHLGNRPGVIICNTVKGKGIPFAEWEPIWHYKSLTEDHYREAMNALSLPRDAT